MVMPCLYHINGANWKMMRIGCSFFFDNLTNQRGKSQPVSFFFYKNIAAKLLRKCCEKLRIAATCRIPQNFAKMFKIPNHVQHTTIRIGTRIFPNLAEASHPVQCLAISANSFTIAHWQSWLGEAQQSGFMGSPSPLRVPRGLQP